MDVKIVEQVLNYANQYGTSIIAISTALYLYVTWRILNENRKVYQGRYMPIICIDYSKDEKRFKVNNIGEGLAIGIEIGSPRYFVKGSDMEFRLDFNKVHNLKPGQTKDLLYSQKLNGDNLNNGPLDAHLYSDYSERDFVFTLIVKDIIGNIYYEKVNMGKSGIFVIVQGRAWWFIRLKLFLMDKIDEMKYFCINYIEKARGKHASPNP